MTEFAFMVIGWLGGAWCHSRVEIEGAPSTAEAAVGSSGQNVGVGRVDLEFFSAFDVPILAGRPFQRGDDSEKVTGGAVIVNRSFVQAVLSGRDPLGRRVRPVARKREGDKSPEPRPWYEIVGVIVGAIPARSSSACVSSRSKSIRCCDSPRRARSTRRCAKASRSTGSSS